MSIKLHFAFIHDASTCRPHSHSCDEIIFNIGCEGVCYENKEMFEFTDSTFSIHKAHNRHHNETSKKGKHLCVGISGEETNKIESGVYKANEEIRESFGLIEKEVLNNSVFKSSMLSALTHVLFFQICRLTGVKEDELNTEKSIALKAKSFLDKNYDKSVNVSDLASSLYISADYLRQLFKKNFGSSPMRYMLEKRILLAQEMLIHSSKSINEIALFCGVDNQYYFSRLFKKMTGHTPTAYRKAFSV